MGCVKSSHLHNFRNYSNSSIKIYYSLFKGLYAFYTILPVILLPEDADGNVNSMMKNDAEGEKIRFKAYSNPDYITAARQLCPFLYKKGAFEITFNRK